VITVLPTEMPAVDALRKGLMDLYAACEHVKTTFEVSYIVLCFHFTSDEY
jgi:formyltetrahydrofolate synthetase